jgi:DMSO/TMAO reductase YedYZ molybdopterin-dependent catalytic subunit
MNEALHVDAAAVNAPSRPAGDDAFTFDELQLAARNHAMPSEALRYALTPSGLHFLLIHFDIPDVNSDTWRLEVGGLVERPLSLSLAALRARPAVTAPVTLECAGNGRALLAPHPASQPWLNEAVGTAAWTGTPLTPILREAGIQASTVEVLFTGVDRGVQGGELQDYARSLALDEALREDVLVVYEMNGAPIPPQHGFPVRLIVPGWYGMTQVKWLRSVTLLDTPFEGYQHTHSYRVRQTEDDPGVPVTRMLPRALIEAPGIPEFATRARIVAPGMCTLRGRAWSGWGPIVRVEISADGGRSWHDASLGEPLAASAWRPWSFAWTAAPGTYDICARATDATGQTQPMQAPWNVGGYMNNSAQHVTVVVQ